MITSSILIFERGKAVDEENYIFGSIALTTSLTPAEESGGDAGRKCSGRQETDCDSVKTEGLAG